MRLGAIPRVGIVPDIKFFFFEPLRIKNEEKKNVKDLGELPAWFYNILLTCFLELVMQSVDLFNSKSAREIVLWVLRRYRRSMPNKLSYIISYW